MNTFILSEAKGYKYLRDRKTGDKINAAVDTVIAKGIARDNPGLMGIIHRQHPELIECDALRVSTYNI